ncbi:hypothetical protein MNBD_ACTINO01-958, partial [hydrothermal vent metagenome]
PVVIGHPYAYGVKGSVHAYFPYAERSEDLGDGEGSEEEGGPA